MPAGGLFSGVPWFHRPEDLWEDFTQSKRIGCLHMKPCSWPRPHGDRPRVMLAGVIIDPGDELDVKHAHEQSGVI